MEKLNREKVLHVADLAKLQVKEEEIEKYGIQLGDILSEIEKIINVEVDDSLNILISPTMNHDCYNKLESESLSKDEIFRNAGKKDEDYIIVPKVIE